MTLSPSAQMGRDVPCRSWVLEFRRLCIFGFLINLPIVSYYQIGTALTANHGHAAMMGVYGMLAVVGLAMFAFRYVIPENKWPEVGPNLVLVPQYRACVDGVRELAPRWASSSCTTLSMTVLRGPFAGLHRGPVTRSLVVAASR